MWRLSLGKRPVPRNSRVIACAEVKIHPRVETRSDSIGGRLDAFIAEVDFGLPPMMRHVNVQG